jgi:hypothetical protein
MRALSGHHDLGMHWIIRSIRSLTPEIVDLLLAAAEERPGLGAGIGLSQLRGAPSRTGAEDSAFGTRSNHVVVKILAGHRAEQDPHRRGSESSFRSLLEEVKHSRWRGLVDRIRYLLLLHIN